MIRCRCGTWTNHGLTCAKYSADAWNTFARPPVDKEEEEEIEEVSLNELEEHIENENEEED